MRNTKKIITEEEESPSDGDTAATDGVMKEEKDSPAVRDDGKPPRLAKRKGQRPAFPFRRKSV